MNCLWQVSTYTAAIVRRTSHFVARSSLYGCANSSWKINFKHNDSELVMEQEKDAFFVVRKGDIVGVYKSLTDCQAQVGSSICDPP
ncbi:hypothetical protein SLA2020_263180 [Shorea laevis]